MNILMRQAHNLGLWILGKTLIFEINFTPARALDRACIMFSLLAQVARLFRFASSELPPSPAAALMESADSRAGMNARQARELRAAASAWLSVVR
ncbi:hypothetical protein [Variovorax soli]|nr:hypothetical protein [Variovorax soli]